MAKTFSIPDTIENIRSAGARFDGHPELDGESLTFTTRDSGDVGDETPGEADLQAGRTLIRSVEAANPNVRGVLGTVDEWTNVTFRAYDQAVPPRPPSHKEMLAALETAGGLLAEKTKDHGFSVRWSSTGREMFAEWKDPEPKSRGACASVSLSFDGGKPDNVLDGNQPADIKSLSWALTLNVGRHKVSLPTLDKKDINAALGDLSKTTDGLKDLFPLAYFVAKSDGGFVARNDYDGSKRAAYSKSDAATWEQWNSDSALKLAEKCDGSVVEQRRGYPDQPFESISVGALRGRANPCVAPVQTQGISR